MFDSTCSAGHSWSKKVPVWKPGKLFLGAAAVVGLPGVPPPAAEVSVSRKDGRFDGLKSLQMELQVWVSNKFQNKNYATWSLTRLWKKSISFLQPFTTCSIVFFSFCVALISDICPWPSLAREVNQVCYTFFPGIQLLKSCHRYAPFKSSA